ncbi:MAG: penicillin-binding transpeptidase domain-containing protein [Streptosporangiales bacterium]
MRRGPVASVLAAGLAAATVAGCTGQLDAEQVAKEFLADWQAGHGKAAGRLTTARPGAVADALDGMRDALHAKRLRLRLGTVKTFGEDRAGAAFHASMRLTTLSVQWSYQGRFALRDTGAGWRVVWKRSVLHPKLKPDEHLTVTRQFPSRAPILGRHGTHLVLNEDVVTVGVVPKLMTDRAHTLRVLARKVGIDADATRKRIADAAPKAFLPLITLRQAAYTKVKPVIHPLPGVHFTSGTLPLAKTRQWARQVLGVVGPISSERLDDLGAPYIASDKVGLYGIEAAYERRLAGVPRGRVVVRDQKNVNQETLVKFAGRHGEAVKTTVDHRVQDAAERALVGVDKPAALVAVQASTGEVLAVGNRPTNSSYDRALLGRYPPGSTFKVITTAALLDHTSLRPGTTVPCPPSISVGGRSFHNFEGETAASPSFRTDFAISCNTAFIRLAKQLPRDALADAARSFGFGARYRLGLSSYSGSAPAARNLTEQAADAIGQGKVLASPLTMALVAAAVKSGTWHPPALVTEPAPDKKGAKPVRLDRKDAKTLRSLMRSVVTTGTGSGVDLPGKPVAGKTGTAEYGSGDPPPTHAWFIGYRGDIAFALLVEGGGVGSKTAVPIARTFLRSL